MLYEVITDSNIISVYDLKDKKVDIGNPGSGERVSMEHLMTQMGWTNDSFNYVSELNADDRAQALCDGKIDAFIYMVGHPSGVLREATNSCDTRLIGLPSTVTGSFRITSYNVCYTKLLRRCATTCG